MSAGIPVTAADDPADDPSFESTPNGKEVVPFGELAPLEVNVNEELEGWKVTFTAGAEIKIWEDASKSVMVVGEGITSEYIIGADVIPETMYVEGIFTGGTDIEAKLFSPGGVEVTNDTVRVTVVGRSTVSVTGDRLGAENLIDSPDTVTIPSVDVAVHLPES